MKKLKIGQILDFLDGSFGLVKSIETTSNGPYYRVDAYDCQPSGRVSHYSGSLTNLSFRIISKTTLARKLNSNVGLSLTTAKLLYGIPRES